MSKRHQKALGIGAVLLFIVLLVPLFMGALGAHMATDDYVFAQRTHATWLQTASPLHVAKDALSYTLRTFRDWQGTISGVLVMCLNPGVISPQVYGIHAPLLLLFWLLTFFLFLRTVFWKRLQMENRYFFGAVYMALVLLQWMAMPTLTEGLYWHNGAWFYTGATAVFFLCYACVESKGRIAYVVGCLCAVFIGLNNYITAALCCALFFLLLGHERLQMYKQKERGAGRWLVPFALALGSLLVSVLAPGNHVRMASDAMYGQEDFWIFRVGLWVLRDAAGYTGRFLFRTPLAIVLCAAFPFCVRGMKAARASFSAPIKMTVLAFVLLCAMLFPHMYTSGYAGPGRIVNLYHVYVVTACVLLMLYWAGWVSRRNIRIKTRTGVILAGGVLAICLICQGGIRHTDYTRLVGEIASGRLWTYRAETQAAQALLEEAEKGTQVVLPPRMVSSVTGMGTGGADPSNWQNIAIAGYYDLAGVIQE